jgi:hypothetical protein
MLQPYTNVYYMLCSQTEFFINKKLITLTRATFLDLDIPD